MKIHENTRREHSEIWLVKPPMRFLKFSGMLSGSLTPAPGQLSCRNWYFTNHLVRDSCHRKSCQASFQACFTYQQHTQYNYTHRDTHTHIMCWYHTRYIAIFTHTWYIYLGTPRPWDTLTALFRNPHWMDTMFLGRGKRGSLTQGTLKRSPLQAMGRPNKD